jgi:hypothetical protein
MIGPDDIAAFEEMNREALAQANEYARRVEKGLPPDRFVTGTKNAVLVGRGIRAQQAIIALFCDYIKELQRPSFEATGVFDRNGRETS